MLLQPLEPTHRQRRPCTIQIRSSGTAAEKEGDLIANICGSIIMSRAGIVSSVVCALRPLAPASSPLSVQAYKDMECRSQTPFLHGSLNHPKRNALSRLLLSGRRYCFSSASHLLLIISRLSNMCVGRKFSIPRPQLLLRPGIAIFPRTITSPITSGKHIASHLGR